MFRTRTTRYDLGASSADDRAFRLNALDRSVLPAQSGRPLAVTAIDDERQRLVIGVKPGTGKNRLGIAYRLRFGR